MGSIARSALLACLAVGCAASTGAERTDADTSEDAALAADGSAPDRDAAPPWEPDAGPVPELDAGQDLEPDAAPEPERCATAPVAGGERPVVNDDPAFVQVLVNNIENLKEPDETCRGDWLDLVHYVRQMRPQPDLFLVQQVSDQAQLDRLVRVMNDELRGTYAGVIAERAPRAFSSPCGPEKDLQTNAIVYRTERFAPAGARHTWQPFARIDGSCRRSQLARTVYVMQRFQDRLADRDVAVVSLHWSTNGGGSGPDPACAERNAADLDATIAAEGFDDADLVLVGGDANEPDRSESGAFRPWHRMLNGDRGGEIGYRDPIYARCAAAPDLARCLDAQWTIGSERRIDFLFARTGDGCMPTTAGAHTVTFDEADAASRAVTGSDTPLRYSDHRAVHAEVYY
jgi:hypothetical protein